MVKGAGLRTLWRRPSCVRIAPPAYVIFLFHILPLYTNIGLSPLLSLLGEMHLRDLAASFSWLRMFLNAVGVNLNSATPLYLIGFQP